MLLDHFGSPEKKENRYESMGLYGPEEFIKVYARTKLLKCPEPK